MLLLALVALLLVDKLLEVMGTRTELLTAELVAICWVCGLDRAS
jgi:hypothetical protein